MHDVDEFFRKSYYSQLRILLLPCGIWPFQALNKRRAVHVGCAFLCVFGISFETLCMIKVWPDFFEIFDCLSLLFFCLVSTIKLIHTAYELPKIKMILMYIHEHWSSPRPDKEAEILRSYARFARKFSYGYSSGVVGICVIFAMTPLVARFLYDVDAVSNNTQDGQTKSDHPHLNYVVVLQIRYTPLYIQFTICEIYYTVVLVSINSLYYVCVQHCCGLFEALRYHLENAFEFGNNDDIMTVSMQNKCHSNIAYGIRRHTEVIQFAMAVESLYRLPFFLHMTVNVSLLSIVGFQVITNTESISSLIPVGTYLGGLLFNMFLENWHGQKIIDCNEKVYDCVYNIEWYRMPIISQKLLIMIMLRCKKPLTITAGKVLILSYVNFNAAVRTGFSYLMLLRSMQ